MRRSLLLIAAMFIFLSSFVLADIQYSIQPLPALPSGTWCMAKAINNHGQIVGSSNEYDPRPSNSGYEQYAVLWEPTGEIIKIASGSSPIGSDINDAGQVVGFGAGDWPTTGFFWDKTTGYQQIGDINYHISGINNNGQVVGYGTTMAFIWQNGGFSFWGNEDRLALPEAINDAGHIVGSTYYGLIGYSKTHHATLWVEGEESFLSGARAVDINNSGQIIGIPTITGGGGFLLENGTVIDLMHCLARSTMMAKSS